MIPNDEPTDREGSATEADPRRWYEWEEGTAPTTAVVEAIAAASEREPMALPPLYESVETDAMDALLTKESDGDGSVRISFRHARVDVSVGSDGRIGVRPAGSDNG